MPTKQDVSDAAFAFLQKVAEEAKAQLGDNLTRTRRSQWMVATSDTAMSSQYFDREAPDTRTVQFIYQLRLTQREFPEQDRLAKLLEEAGIDRQDIPYGYMTQLIANWLQSSNPLALDGDAADAVLDDFARAVVDKLITVRSRDAFAQVNVALVENEVSLDENVILRPIYQEELWTFGDTDRFPFDPMRMPSERWSILDIRAEDAGSTRQPVGQVFSKVNELRRAALSALPILSPGYFSVVALGVRNRYGPIAGSQTPVPENIGRGHPYVLNGEDVERLREWWPRIRDIMTSDDHYLRLPAQRLFDGGSRSRADDAVIDYAIGLEALLLAGTQDELSYRFSLRGATILAWDKPGKAQHFQRLKSFYDVRSAVAHGRVVPREKLSTAMSDGEEVLRQIWQWCFNLEDVSLKEATKKIDAEILK